MNVNQEDAAAGHLPVEDEEAALLNSNIREKEWETFFQVRTLVMNGFYE